MKVMTVAEINNYIKNKMEKDLVLGNLWLKGEISNYKHHSSGHLYYTLKDSKAAIKCVMFRSRSSALKFSPENGMSVLARGYVSVFERDGQYQLYVEEMQPDGIGALYIAFRQLKEQLEQEGLFRSEIKKPLPLMPKKVAVITSPTGAAVRDIITVLHRRCPQVEILIIPVAVQGDSAAPQIAEALKMVNDYSDPVDVIIVGRGGGSLEELWAFNTEIVARGIFASTIPVVSAVGHETDFTIADFVADLRAPTPSAAAELVVPDFRNMLQRFSDLRKRLFMSLETLIERKRHRIRLCQQRAVLSRPLDRVNTLHQRLDLLVNKLERQIESLVADKEKSFKVLAAQLNKLSPLDTLQRGYAVCSPKESGGVLTKRGDFFPGQQFEVIIHDGIVECTVDQVKEGTKWRKS